MPEFIAKIKLISGTENDYNRLSDELRKRSFRTPVDLTSLPEQFSNDVIVLSTFQPTLLEVNSSISEAASRIGKEFSFTVQKKKA